MPTTSIDYFSRDFVSLRNDLLKLISFFTPEWTDRNPDDLGVVLIELFSYVGDIIHFYVDKRAQDLYLPTAFTRQSVVNLLKLIDYNVPGKKAATADEEFTIVGSPIDETVTIPASTRLQAPAGTGGDPVQFETLKEYKFAYTTLTADASASDIQITVTNALDFIAEQTVNVRDDVTPGGEQVVVDEIVNSSTIKLKSGLVNGYTTAQNAKVSVVKAEVGVQQGQSYFDSIGNSDGSPFQIFVLPRLPVIEGAVKVYVDETGSPELWTEVESLAYAEPGEKVYELSQNYQGYVIVRFGDGTQGKIPNSGSPILSVYRVGGGIIGNVGADKITKLLDTISYTGGPVNFSVTNPEQASGGAEEQTIEVARYLGPKSLRALNRAVTLEDFATLARLVTGVREAKAIIRGSEIFREIDVYIVPEGGLSPSAALIELTRQDLQDKAMAGTLVFVNGPKHVVDVLLTAVITVVDGISASAVRLSVENVLSGFFSVTGVGAQFGMDVNLSDVMALIDNVIGVDHVDISRLTLDPATTLEWEVGPDDPAVVDYIEPLNSLALIDQTYTIKFTGSTTYDVENGVGSNVGSGTLGSELSTTDGALKIKLSAGTDPMTAGDRAVFRTSQYIGNVEIEDFEIRQLGVQVLSFTGGI